MPSPPGAVCRTRIQPLVPAKAGTQGSNRSALRWALDSRFRGNEWIVDQSRRNTTLASQPIDNAIMAVAMP
jgi:hypothetical protein